MRSNPRPVYRDSHKVDQPDSATGIVPLPWRTCQSGTWKRAGGRPAGLPYSPHGSTTGGNMPAGTTFLAALVRRPFGGDSPPGGRSVLGSGQRERRQNPLLLITATERPRWRRRSTPLGSDPGDRCQVPAQPAAALSLAPQEPASAHRGGPRAGIAEGRWLAQGQSSHRGHLS